MTSTVVRSYRSGGWYAVFGENAAVLLPPSERARVGAMWEMVDRGSDFEELLDALIAGGLRGLPGFVLVSSGEAQTRVVLRGPARATFTLADGDPVELDGAAAATWVERVLEEVTAMRLDLEGGGGPDDYVLETGLVRVSRVDEPPYVERVAEASHVATVFGPAEEPVEPPAEAPAEPEPAGAHLAPVVPLGEITDAEADAERPLEDPLFSADSSAVSDAEEEGLPLPVPHEPGEEPIAVAVPVAAAAPVAVPHVEDLPGEPTEAFSPVPEQPPVAPPAREEPEESMADEDGDHHWPFSDPDAPEDSSAEDDAAEEQAPEQAPEEQVAPRSQSPFGADTPVEFSDHDGNTVAGGWDPGQFDRQQPGIPGQPPAPSVTAQPVARLAFSSGETVDVDRAILIGRAPEARRFTSTDQPRLVTVPSPHQEISSTHIEVRPGSGADHGSAVVTDMGSTNGTVLVQPGLSPEDLQPGMPVQLLPGAVIDLGDGVTIHVTNV